MPLVACRAQNPCGDPPETRADGPKWGDEESYWTPRAASGNPSVKYSNVNITTNTFWVAIRNTQHHPPAMWRSAGIVLSCDL